MSWLFSQVLAEEYLGDIFLDGEQSALLNGNPTQQAYCAPDKMTDFSRLSRFGMTYKPLTESRGEELLMSYRAVFLARTSAWQARAQESTESGQACGPTWRGSLAMFDPATSSWKTAQPSLLEDLGECSVTWPRSGMTADGQCWELPRLVPPTGETGSGWLLPTPSASHCETRPAKTWNPKSQSGRSLGCMAATGMWPTPTSHNAKETAAPSEALRNTPTLAAQAGGSLNPTWVEWLMGWPLGWTDLKPLVTDKSHCVQQQLGAF
jgi:hypothetical protein